jgi:predicted small lipoprotein YifL
LLLRLAAIGALVCALGLAACGRKGGLDPPPGALVTGEPPIGTSTEPRTEADGKPLPPGVPRRRTPIDFLID